MKLLGGVVLILIGVALAYIVLSPLVSFWLLPKRRYHYYYIDWGSFAVPGAILILALLAIGGGIYLLSARRAPSEEN
jgi:hypothetical protein